MFEDVTWAQPGRRGDKFGKGESSSMSASESHVKDVLLEGITSGRQTRCKDLFEAAKSVQGSGAGKTKNPAKRELPDENDSTTSASKHSCKRGDESDEVAEKLHPLKDGIEYNWDDSKPKARTAKAAKEDAESYDDRVIGLLEASRQDRQSALAPAPRQMPELQLSEELRSVQAQVAHMDQWLTQLTGALETLVSAMGRQQQQQQQPFAPAPSYGMPGYGARFGPNNN
ncbi:hypothetical protein BCR44DRAFT_61447 [Catenaria anguillulae PL171]|uniref:Uncharacterized protein n=1 Tax=Catenaria anguillulae PL171 TaxID=765915 RepID=A0A1Y2HGY9_9FUNG|nr:hypothetical protein BCR44DRAFT_61447 [Catenaria anguillulae PL171]